MIFLWHLWPTKLDFGDKLTNIFVRTRFGHYLTIKQTLRTDDHRTKQPSIPY